MAYPAHEDLCPGQNDLGQAAQRAAAGNPVHYERRRPEETTLYRLVQEHAETFFAHIEAETGANLPQFVKDEFDAFLACGILAHGFLRLRCGDCGHEKLVAFSCRRRGFCPSCGARRMAQSAAHLVTYPAYGCQKGTPLTIDTPHLTVLRYVVRVALYSDA